MASSDLDRNHWIGFDLGGTKMLAGVYNTNFELLGREKKKTKAHLGQKAGLQRMISVMKSALDEANLKPTNIAGIGVGCPGPLDLNRGVVLDTPNLGWSNMPLKDELEKEFSCPVVIANDVDLGVYGEYRFGAAKNSRCALGIFPGTGIGGGCVYDGVILRGATGSAMEIGHIHVTSQGPACGCGRNGCLETIASRLAIAAQCAQAAHRGDAPALMEAAGTDLANIRSGAIAASIRNGDKAVEKIVRQAARQIGLALGSVVNLLAPDKVVLGGGLVEEMPKLFVEEVTKKAMANVMPAFVDTFEVSAAELGDDAAVQGAAAWAQKCFGKSLVSA